MVTVLLLVLLPSLPLSAQTARGGGGANALLLQQMQQLTAERASLQAENAKLKQGLEDLRKDRDTLKDSQQAVAQRARAAAAALDQSNTKHAQATQQLAQTKAEIQELIAKFSETIQKLKQAEADDVGAKQTLAVSEREIDVCIDHDVALYKLDLEVLSHSERESSWTRVARMEPFTQIARARLENRVDDYRARANDLRLDPANPSGWLLSAAPRSPPPASPAKATAAPGSSSGAAPHR
jgi:chromosome segregation ATPase